MKKAYVVGLWGRRSKKNEVWKKKQMSYGVKENEEEHSRVVTVVGFGELEQIEERNKVDSWVFDELEQILWVFEEIFEEIEELEEQESRGFKENTTVI